MAKTKIRIRVCVGYNKDHSPVVKQISADSELELADRVAVTLMQSERRDEFIRFAKEHQELKFLVTKIGCGIAGFTIEEIAPLFREAIDVENVILPEDFVEVLYG